MRGIDMPVTPEAIRSRFLAYHAAWLIRAEAERGTGDPEIQELTALLIRVEHGAGHPEVRVRCSSGPGTGHLKTAVITAGLHINDEHLPAHSPIA